MKNRRTVIVAFMLVAAMVIGVGYAAMTGTLTINGTATYFTPDSNDAAGTVAFSHVTIKDNDVDVTANYDTTGQTGTVTIVFDADEAVDGKISKTVYYTVTYDYDETASVCPKINVTVNSTVGTNPGNALTVEIKDTVETADTTLSNFTLNPNDTENVKVIAVTATIDVAAAESALAADASSANYAFTITMPYVNASTT